jgi:DNA-binding response OmpR family regulator
MHALVVEDDPDISSALVETLEGAGFRVTSARDGRQAVGVAAEDPPDLVTLDLTLPHMDGIEVCRRIREASDCYIVIVSARSDEVDKPTRPPPHRQPPRRTCRPRRSRQTSRASSSAVAAW